MSLTQISQRGLLIKFPRARVCVFFFIYLRRSLPSSLSLSLSSFAPLQQFVYFDIRFRVLFLFFAISRASQAEAFGLRLSLWYYMELYGVKFPIFIVIFFLIESALKF